MAHDFATALGLALARWRHGIAARDELVGSERAWMATVCVEGDEERRPLADEAYACMGMTVDAALVSLGEPEPPLEVQVVAGEVAATAVHEQPGSEALITPAMWSWRGEGVARYPKAISSKSARRLRVEPRSGSRVL